MQLKNKADRLIAAIRDVRSLGLNPDLVSGLLLRIWIMNSKMRQIACRCSNALASATIQKIADQCDVSEEDVYLQITTSH